jgi:hypothetical protein
MSRLFHLWHFHVVGVFLRECDHCWGELYRSGRPS